MKILLKAPFSPFSGYGLDGIGIAQTLLAQGHDVVLDPTHVDAPLPKAVAMLLTKPLEPPFDLAIVHVDPGQMDCSPEMRRSATMVIGWTMWEYTTLDNLKNKKTLRKRLRNFDAMVAYDQVTADALRPHLGEGTDLLVQQGGYDPDAWKLARRDWFEDRFAFCMVGALHDRKDPFVAIEAFRQLKEERGAEFEGAELHLKTVTPGLHPAMEQWVPKLRVHYAVWPTDVMQAFFASQHCLLAPSRGEGKNLPALQMLSTGGTVIATNWGGHQQWMSSNYAYPLNYELAPEGKFAKCMSARASVDHLKELMWHVYTNRAEARQRGETAASIIPQMCGWEPVVDHLFLKLRSVKSHGEEIYTRAQMTRALS